jgi:serine protease Do
MARCRLVIAIAGWLAGGVAGAGLAMAAGPAREPAPGYADLVARLLPAVVNVAAVHEAPAREARDIVPLGPGVQLDELFRDLLERQRRNAAGGNAPASRSVVSVGSGFIVDPTGWIVTNEHVVADASRIRVTLSDGVVLTARLAGQDQRTDLALLKVETRKPLRTVGWGASDTVRVGDWVVTIGNPFGLGNSVAAGIVSGRNRDLHTGPYDEYIQTDAAMNTGNSGGPMFDMGGRVIGIDTAIYTQTGGSVGVGFAIPSSLAQPVIDELRRSGHVTRGYIGVQLETVTDEIARVLALDAPRGALITQVASDGPAAGAALRRGDVILAVDGAAIGGVRQVQRRIASLPIGQVAHLSVWRDHREQPLEVRIAAFPEPTAKAAGAPPREPMPAVGELLGLRLGPITAEARQAHALGERTAGVAVTDVVPSSPAEAAGLVAGDLILALDGSTVATPEDAAQRLRQAAAARRKPILVLFDRDGERRFAAVRPDAS